MYQYRVYTNNDWIYDDIQFEWNEKGKFKPNFEEKIKYGKCVYEGLHRHYFIAYINDEIVGICKIKIGGQESLMNPGYSNWLDFISVDPAHQGKGISRKLLEMCFKYLHDKGETHFLSSGYTRSGFDRIRPIMHSLALKYNFDFKDENKVSF